MSSYMGKELQKPKISPYFFYGTIQKWSFSSGFLKLKEDNYAYRFTIYFSNGKKKQMQKSGFPTQKAASLAKEQTIVQLNNQKFIPFRFSVEEFYDFWLYYYMLEERNIKYNTFISYRNIISNYLLPYCKRISRKRKLKITNVQKNHLMDFLLSIEDYSVFQLACTIIRSSFLYAKANNIIDHNYAVSAVSLCKKIRKKPEKKSRPILSREKASSLLFSCKQNYEEIYLLFLISLCCGTRISEVVALKFKDIDMEKQTIHIQRQLGRSIDDQGMQEQNLLRQEIAPKTDNGDRFIPLPRFVMDELILEEYRRKMEFPEGNIYESYIGIDRKNENKPFLKDKLRKIYKKMLLENGIPLDLRWHDLRHSYSTLLYDSGISLKSIAQVMGHESGSFTKEVYIKEEENVFDISAPMNELLKKRPKAKEEIFDIATAMQSVLHFKRIFYEKS